MFVGGPGTPSPLKRPAEASTGYQANKRPLLAMVPGGIELSRTDDPFWEYRQSDIPLQFSLAMRPPNQMGVVSHTLDVSSELLDLLRRDGNRLHVRCFITKTDPLHPPSHSWPSGFTLRVNSSFVDVSKREEKKKTLPLPADISDRVRVGPNTLTLTTSSLMPHYVVVQVASPVRIDTVVQRVLNARTLSLDDGRKRIVAAFGNGSEGVVATTMKLSLLDPIVRTRLRIPVRGARCRHPACFDLGNFLSLNERVRRWECPLCSDAAPFDTLVVDQFIQQCALFREPHPPCLVLSVLNVVPHDEVTFLPDGSWLADTAPAPLRLSGAAMRCSDAHVVEIEDSSISDDHGPTIKEEEGVVKPAPIWTSTPILPPAEAVLILDSDDD